MICRVSFSTKFTLVTSILVFRGKTVPTAATTFCFMCTTTGFCIPLADTLYLASRAHSGLNILTKFRPLCCPDFSD